MDPYTLKVIARVSTSLMVASLIFNIGHSIAEKSNEAARRERLPTFDELPGHLRFTSRVFWSFGVILACLVAGWVGRL